MRTNSGFDLLAPVYDRLARFVFGKSIVDSQVWFLEEIQSNSTVLILGGGTGWLLEELQRSNCTVWYVEISSAMMKRARLRKTKNVIHYIQGTIDDIPAGLAFDVVITNFYLDLFSDETLSQVIRQISTHTTPSSSWLVTDFEQGDRWWHRWMLKIMYLFFRIVCRIEARRLPRWSVLLKNGWKETNARLWYNEFIKSTVWHRLY